MAEEILELEISADTTKLQQGLKEAEMYARDTGKRLEKEELINLRINETKLQLQLNKVSRLIREAKKEGDKQLEFDLTLQQKNLRRQLTEAGRQLTNYTNTGDKKLSRLQAKFDGVNRSIWAMKGLLAKATVALTAFFSVRKVQELSEAFTNLQNRLKQVAEGEQLDQLQEKIFEGANSARVSVEEYASAFLRFDLVNKQLGGSQEETLKIMDSLAKGLSASGAAASEVNSVMLQLAQAFWSGRLAGDEFRSVSENMPILLDILAEKLGVARGELKELAADGKITSEVLKNALIDANEKLNESFEKTSVTIGQAMTVATNDFVKKYGEMDEVYEITNKTTTAIFTLKDGLIVLVDAVFYLVNVFSKWFQAIAATVGTTILGVSETIIGVFKTVVDNTGVLVRNMGIAFWNLPEYAKDGLNLFLKKLEETVNKAIKILNKIPKVNIEPVKLDLGVWGGTKTEFEAFKNSFDFTVTTRSAKKAKGVYDEFTASLWAFRKESKALGTDLLRGEGVVPATKEATEAQGAYKDKLEETKKEVQKIGDANAKVYEGIVDDIEGGVDSLGKFIEEVIKVEAKIEDFGEEAKDSIRDINNELNAIWEGTAESLGARFLAVGSEIEELKDSIKESKKEGGDIIERRKMRQDLNRLEQERLLIIENTTEAEREQAKAISELSEAQKILSSAEEQKKVLEERKKLYEAIQEGEKINLEEIQDYENLKLAEGLVAKQEALNTELETVQANYDAQREAIMKLTEEKKNFEKEWTDFFGTEIQKQKGYADDLITKLRRIIALQKEAGIEASGFSSGRVSSSSGSNSVTTNNNQRRVDVNITANNNVDIDYAVEKISEKIQ